MPYAIFPVRKGGKVIGYKVGKKDRSVMDNGRRYLSDKPLSKKRAEAQLKAVGISEAGRMRSPVPVRQKKNVIIFVPHGECSGPDDRECDQDAKKHAVTLFTKMKGRKDVTKKENKDYHHHQSDNLHLLISRSHRSKCDIMKGECSRVTKVMDKLRELVMMRGEKETFIMNVKSFPKGDELDRPNDDHLIIEYPRGKKVEANLIREVMEDTFGKNVVMKVENGKNKVYDSYNSPINVTLMLRDGTNF
tara:strand:+ start:3828 stop:4568 length:741 start_codon:yes stop_codon:yes gene_type:complete